MGTKAETKEDEIESKPGSEAEGQEPEYGGEVPSEGKPGSLEGGEGETATDEDEVDIVLRGQEGSQPVIPQYIGLWKRFSKLSGKIEHEKGRADDNASQLEIEREKNKLLELALKQKETPASKAPSIPNPEDFDSGVYDPEFIKKHGEYTQYIVEEKVKEAVLGAQKSASDRQSVSASEKDLDDRKDLHYQKAEKLKVKDYEESEMSARKVMGDKLSDDIITLFSNVSDGLPTSEAILYYYGKNKGEAAKLEALARSNTALALAEIGSKRAQIQIVRKNKQLPDPDEPLKGGSSFFGGSSKRAKGARFY